jgi:nitrate reductase gamma subunit
MQDPRLRILRLSVFVKTPMNTLLYLVLYASMVVFLIGCVLRILQYSRAPLHLRWELYPVPHEEARRAAHGGSYFETADWWTKPTHYNLMGELKVFIPEVLFLKGCWEFNRKLWFRSYPFHVGLYLLITSGVLLAFSGMFAIFLPGLMAGAFGTGLQWLYGIIGVLGFLLSILGALGLLVRRLTDAQLKIYTARGDIFNLLFFIASFGIFSAGYLLRPESAPDMLALTTGLFTFDTNLQVPPLFAAGLLLIGILVAYIPMTHMSHFIAKYFTYHSVRWDDAINRRGGSFEAKLAEVLAFRPTWAAAHIKADGKKTWAEIVHINPSQGEKK